MRFQDPVTAPSWTKDIQQAEIRAFQTLAINRTFIHRRNTVQHEFGPVSSFKTYYPVPQAMKNILNPKIQDSSSY